MVEQCRETSIPVEFLKEGVEVETALLSEQLGMIGRVNLMQSVYPKS